LEKEKIGIGLSSCTREMTETGFAFGQGVIPAVEVKWSLGGKKRSDSFLTNEIIAPKRVCMRLAQSRSPIGRLDRD